MENLINDGLDLSWYDDNTYSESDNDTEFDNDE